MQTGPTLYPAVDDRRHSMNSDSSSQDGSRIASARPSRAGHADRHPIVSQRTRLLWSWLAVLACLTAGSGPSELQAREPAYETIRFFDSRSKPEKIHSFAFSPEGRFLALCTNDRGVAVIDLRTMELLEKHGRWSYHTVAFSPNSRKLLCLGNYAVEEIDLTSNTVRRIRLPESTGYLGLNLELKNGKVLIQAISTGSFASTVKELAVGDELLAVSYGEKPTLYNDQREWTSLVGKSVDNVIKSLVGPPGTWVRLKLMRKGSPGEFEVALQRQAHNARRPPQPASRHNLTLAQTRGAFSFRVAPSGDEYSYVRLQNLENRGQFDVSPDARHFAFVAKIRRSGNFGVEVHDLTRSVVQASLPFEHNNYRALKFSGDSQKVLVGTRDSIEILDVKTAQWDEPIPLVADEDRDEGRVVQRRIPLGFGFPGDLYTTVPQRVYASPAALTAFGVSPAGAVAVGSQQGDLVLFDLNSRERIGLLGEEILGAPAEMVEFSPDGKTLAAFAKGQLHLFRVAQTERLGGKD